MENYLVAYYDGNVPTFAYTDTIDTARTCALNMVSNDTATRKQALSIVEISTDRVIYYGKGKQLADRLSTLGRPTPASTPAWRLFLKSVVSSLQSKRTVTAG